jgi:hypothetical protein
MTDRFDLEQQIMSCWNIVDELDYVTEMVTDNDDAMNVLMGLKALYTKKFEKLQNLFEEVIRV